MKAFHEKWSEGDKRNVDFQGIPNWGDKEGIEGQNFRKLSASEILQLENCAITSILRLIKTAGQS